MQHPVNRNDAIPVAENGRKCISAEEKFFNDVSFWTFQICFFVKNHFAEVCILLCAVLVLRYWKRQIGKSKRKICKKFRRPPPHALFEMAMQSCDKITADLCIEAIQECDYDVNYQFTSNKLSLFLCACLSGNSKVMMYMIKRGADVKLCTVHGDSALYLATYGYLHSSKPDLRAISMLVEYGCDVNQPNFSGFTVLHQAAGKGNLFLTQYFIFKGADPSQQNDCGLLPYHIAVIGGHKEVADFLKERLKPLSKRTANTI